MNTAEAQKTDPSPKRAGSMKVADVKTSGEDAKKRRLCQYSRIQGCEGSYQPQKCKMFQSLSPLAKEWVIKGSNFSCSALCMLPELSVMEKAQSQS
jgi:hypothetical protein